MTTSNLGKNLAKSRAAAYGVNTRSVASINGVVSSDQKLDAKDQPRGFFADQFEASLLVEPSLELNLHQNRSNFEAHYQGTGPEIWRQSGGRLDAFVSGAGNIRHQVPQTNVLTLGR